MDPLRSTGHQLEVVRRLRRRLPERQQLAVDAVHHAARRQPHLHRDQVLAQELRPLPGDGAAVQGDLLAAILRVRRGDEGASAVAARELQADRRDRRRRGQVRFFYTLFFLVGATFNFSTNLAQVHQQQRGHHQHGDALHRRDQEGRVLRLPGPGRLPLPPRRQGLLPQVPRDHSGFRSVRRSFLHTGCRMV